MNTPRHRPLSLDFLRAFEAVSRRLSFSAAAEELHLTQSAVSRQVAALEADASRFDEWWTRIDGWRDKHPLRYDDSADSEIKPQYMIEAAREATGGENPGVRRTIVPASANQSVATPASSAPF